ncbi:hypothetical protein [Desulfotruncus alcoholivorax]|uniref:hypothetical protein n=1 Tax=Desulfotruncus alcoholivorax TaxID=265477 RepID=UPI000400BF13|nr:hypothetical protein [Desulfotruncus alcoholivorax]
MFMTLFIILAACFGLGAVIGFTYATIRYGIPIIIFGIKVILGGIIGIFSALFGGMKAGWEDAKQNMHRLP